MVVGKICQLFVILEIGFTAPEIFKIESQILFPIGANHEITYIVPNGRNERVDCLLVIGKLPKAFYIYFIGWYWCWKLEHPHLYRVAKVAITKGTNRHPLKRWNFEKPNFIIYIRYKIKCLLLVWSFY